MRCCVRRALHLAGVPLVFAPFAVSSSAQQAPSRPTLSDIVAYALRSNPDLITARLLVDSAHGETRIARALPNPTFTTIPGNPSQYSIEQTLDVGPERIYRTRAADQAVVATQYDVKDVERQVVFNIRQGYFDLLLAEALRDIVAEQLDTDHQLLQADSLRYEAGDLPQKDVSATELQWAHAEATMARADASARAARIALQVLMGVRHPDTAFRVSGSLQYTRIELPADSLQARALANRPDVAAAQERLQQSGTLRSAASADIIPVPGVAAVYQPAQPFPTGSRYALGFSFSVPILYGFGGERERATAGAAAAAVARQRAEVQVESDVTIALDSFHASQALAERYASGLLDRARAALDMQRYAYEQGNASLLDVLNAISTFGDIQTDYYTALHDYAVSAYAIDRAVGQEIVP
jgi:outer membrane protein, heavy metal efflux system